MSPRRQPPGIRDDVHLRFVALLERVDVRVWAEAYVLRRLGCGPDEPEAAP